MPSYLTRDGQERMSYLADYRRPRRLQLIVKPRTSSLALLLYEFVSQRDKDPDVSAEEFAEKTSIGYKKNLA